MYKLAPAAAFSRSFIMAISLQERSLAERLKHRIAVEQYFALTGKKFRKKSFVLRHEDILVKPWLKLGLGMVGLYSRGLRNAISPVIRNITLHFDDLPKAFDGFEILHISDLHIDGVDGLAEALAALLEPLRPDVCVMTGDYRFENDGPCEEVYPRMRRVISGIHARDGVFGILGNHDSSEIAFALEGMGMRMLVNEAVEIERGKASLWIAGLDDSFDYRCDDLPGTLASIPREDFKILLSHTPELYAEAARSDVQLYLAGHTHAGQFRFPGIGSIRHNAKCPKQYSHGHWRHEGMQGYTSAGAGCSMLPIRFNCPPEVARIELKQTA